MMAQYTYRFADLLSDSDIAEIELSGVKFDRRIIQPGAFSANIIVTNQDIANQVKKIVPSKTIVHVYRDADIWGTYIIWSVRVQSSSRAGVNVSISGASLESWFDRRIVDTDLTYSQVDQFDIARDLLATAQAGWNPHASNAQLSIFANTDLSGVKKDRSYYLSDAASVGQRLQELANTDDGFEYMINTYEDTTTGFRMREMVLANQLGSDVNLNTFSYPGSILSYEINWDATQAGTAFWTRGDSIQDDVTADARPLIITSPWLSDDWLNAGFPHIDKVVDYSSVTNIDTLNNYAQWWRDNHSGFVSIPAITINLQDTPTVFSPSLLGSNAQFTIYDEYFGLVDGKPEFSQVSRIVGMEVTPNSRGTSESIRFIIEDKIDPTNIS
jgi:hypothetical protein